jgi:hypothetical protein
VYEETTAGEIPRELRNKHRQTHAYLIAPRSYRKRLPLVARHQLGRGLNRLRSLVRR